jgi:hypothetical protein
MDTVEEHFHAMNHRPEMEDMDTVDTDMEEDKAAELEWLKDSPMAWCWQDTGLAMEREATPNLLGVGGACETRVLKRSTHVYNLRLQL